MQDIVDMLAENAVLEIVEFDVHVRSEMHTIGRSEPYYVMSYLKEGEALLRMQGKEYIAGPGVVTIIPAFVKHDHIKTSKAPSIFFWWSFNFRIAGLVDLLQLMNLPVTFKVKNADDFEDLFMQYVELTEKPQSIYTSILRRAKGLEVMAVLLESVLLTNPTHDLRNVSESFTDILLWIVQHPEEKIRLKTLSEKYNMHPTYISNRFKELFGVTPIRLHRQISMNKAKLMLESANLSVSEVAHSFGFENLSSFTRLFTEYEGTSPSQCKRRQGFPIR
jgi:AraC-like DNA-binding protein